MKNLCAVVLAVVFMFPNNSPAGRAYLGAGIRWDYCLTCLLVAVGLSPTDELIESLKGYFSDQNTIAQIDVDVTELEDLLTYNLLRFPGSVPISGEIKRSCVYSNEGHPEKICEEREKLAEQGVKIRKGAYIAVGSERGFLSAPIFEATHLVLVDNSQLVLKYNTINVALLTVSESRTDYIYLRFYAGLEIWKARAKNSAFTIENFKFWRSAVRQLPPKECDKDPERHGLQMLHLNDPDYFQGVNYLYDDVLWQYLHNLAISNSIFVYRCDLGDSFELRDFFIYLQARNISIGVFDLSNAWWVGFKILLEKILRDVDTYELVSSDPASCSAFLFTERPMGLSTREMFDSWTYWLMPYKSEEWRDGTLKFEFKTS